MDEDQVNDSLDRADRILKYFDGRLSKEESAELEEWIVENEENFRLYTTISEAFSLELSLKRYAEPDTDAFWKKVNRKMEVRRRAVIERQAKNRRRRWMAAASVVFVIVSLGLGAIWLGSRSRIKVVEEQRYAEDVFPIKNARPELILGDGSRIFLPIDKDSSFNLSGVAVSLSDGTLSYDDSIHGRSVVWNTLIVPRGGVYKLKLPDGTRVWLNTASSIQYPTAFLGDERPVRINGEAYFEVARKARTPFRVNVNDQIQLEVLGTSFNVSAYRDENTISTTLLEGSIAVNQFLKTKESISDSSVILEPGQQAIVRQRDDQAVTGKGDPWVKVVNNADIEKAVDWKNGVFIFDRTPIGDVMRQLQRWYDIQVIYDNKISTESPFTGEIDRRRPISEVLRMMALTGIADFRIAERTIYLKPAN